jgi:hypothetical protein
VKWGGKKTYPAEITGNYAPSPLSCGGMSFTQLKRYPFRQHDPLQAFDSADELIIDHLKTLNLNEKRILIIQDQFGALASNLKQYNITNYTDSYVSSRGTELNSKTPTPILHSLDSLSGMYDLVLLKLPKSMAFFEDILCSLTTHLHSNSEIICGAMIKHLPKSAFELIEKTIGQTHTSLAKKKARLIFARFEKTPLTSPYPIEVMIDPLGRKFLNHSNLFSRDKLDIGTRFFLEHIPEGPFEKILDLGCANGIIGISAKLKNPKAKIIFADESQMAILSAKHNYQSQFYDEAEFIWTNCYENQERESLDLILCNPPFHQNNMVGDFIALQMFKDAHYSLKKGGKLRVIGNSHLPYPTHLKKIFGNSSIIATHPKFIITDAIK